MFHLKTFVHKNAIAISGMKSTQSVVTTLTQNCPLDTLSSFTHRIVAVRVLDMIYCLLWQYRLWSFQGRDTKLESILAQNQL